MLHPEVVPNSPVRRLATIALSLIVVLATIFVFAERAAAEVDAPGGVTGANMTGLGTQGAFSFTGTTGGTQTTVPNKAAPIPGAVAAGATSLVIGTVNSTSYQNVAAGRLGADLVAGNLVMVIQSKGWANATLADQTPIDLYTGTVGQWEFARIQSVAGTTINFTTPLANSYPAGTSQIVSVPEYSTMTLGSTGTGTRVRVMSAPAWDGSSGGVLAFLATGAVTVNGRGQIDTTGDGMRGAAADNSYTTIYYACSVTEYDGGNNGRRGEGIYSAGYGATEKGRGNKTNGGGGGNCHNAGGGGGGHGGQGGNAGYSWDNGAGGSEQGQNIVRGGIGGAKLTYSLFDRIAFGGGGGAGEGNNGVAGDGGSGGGAIFIRGGSLASASGLISANGGAGETGTNGSAYDGSGGGGAGGSISLRFTGALACGTGVTATGGMGGSSYQQHGTGAGGGGGKIALQGTSVTCTPDVNNGVAGDNGTGYSGWGSGPTGSGDVTSSGASNAETGTISAPTVAISTPLNGGITNSATPSISGTGTVGAEIRVTIDGVYVGSTTVAAGGAWTYVSAALTGGAHTVTVRPVRIGIWGTATATNTFTVDLTAPTVNITAPTTPTNSTASKNVSFTTSDNVSVATVQCAVDAGAFAACTSPFATGTLAAGSHTVYVRATDTAGNITTQSVPIDVDLTPPAAPSVTRTAPASTPTQSTSATITYGGIESGATAQCSTDNSTWATCTASPVSLTGLTDGTKNYYVRQVDQAGNTGPSASVTWVVDTTAPAAPTVTRTSPTANPTNSTSQTITYSGIEGGATAQCSTDNGTTWATCGTSPITLSGLTAGTKTYSVRQIDAAGNTGSATTVTWVVDLTAPAAPTVTRTAPASSPTNSTNATITYSGIEGGATAQCSTDNSTWSTCAASPVTLTGLTEGTKNYYVRQIDSAGNAGPSASVTWVVDTTAPVAPTVTRTAPTSSPTNSTTATITYSSIEGGATAQCSTDNSTWATCAASPVSLTGLTAGTQNYYVRQIDSAGNTGPSASVTWVVDLTPPAAPTVTRTSPTATPTNSTSQTITYSGIEGSATAQCSTDNGTTWATCGASPVTLSGLTAGTKTYSVRQIDAAGNTGSATTVTWVVDLTPPAAPTVTRTAPTSSPTNSTSATITYSGIEGGATAQCSNDGTTWTTCAGSPVGLTGLTEGTKTYYVRQVDSAGNTGTSNSVSWIVDTTAPAAPTVTRTAPATSPTSSTNATITYSGIEGGATAQCSTDNSTWNTCAASPVALSGLTEGTKNYYVRQIDQAGNTGPSNSVTWVIDTTAPAVPTVTRTAPTSSPTQSTNATITYSGIEGGATAQCSTDNSTWNTCTASPVNLSGLTDGTKNYYVRQVDSSGNTSPAGSVTWVVDTTAPAAPTVTRTSPTTTPTNSTSQAITYSGIEPGATAQCSTDGGTNWTTCGGSPVNLTGLSDGTKTYSVRQIDSAGNTGSATTVTWTVDTAAPSAPSVTRAAPATSPTSSTSATITYGGIEGGATAQCSTDNSTWATCTASPVSLTGLTEGTKNYYVRQIDSAGNTGPSASVTWVVDTTAPAAPTVTRTSPTASPTNSTSQTITYSGIEGGATAQCSTDNSTWATCSASPVSLTGLTAGTQNYYVRQIDSAGNTGPSASVTWVVDLTPPAAPTVTRTSPTATPTNSTSQTISYSGIEGGATAQCSTDNGTTWTTCGSSPVTLSGLTDGTKTYSVRQIDSAGNTGSATTVTWVVDTGAPVAPTVTRTAPTSSPTNSTNATISYSGIEGGATAQCSTDGTTWATCAASPVSLTGLTAGNKTYYVRQIDAAGNTGPSNSVSWVVDLTPPAAPTVTRTSPTASPTNSTTQAITYSGIEGSATAQCSTDNSTWSTCSASPVTLTGLTEGTKNYYVRQIDAAGNTGPSASVTWVVDTTAPAAPTVTRSTPTASPTNSASQTITYSGIEGGATAQCSTDNGSTWTTCAASPITLSGLTEGTKTYSVRQIDSAGNTGSATTVTWVVDTTAPAAPTVTRTAPTANPTNSTSQTLTYGGIEGGATAQCSTDNGSTWTTCSSSPVTLSGLTAGTKTFSVRQIDSAGNTGAATTVSWVVDLTAPAAPTVTRTAPTGTPTNSTSASITYSGIEGGATAQCSTDGTTWNTCASSPVALSSLTEGTKTYYVRQIDAAGNTGPSASVTWVVDTTTPIAPTVTRTAPTSSPTNSTNATITYSGIEGGATAQCSTDGSTWATCTGSPVSLTGLTAGTKNYYVRQIDAAGNTGASNSVSWVVDLTAPAAPTVTRTSPTASPTNSTSQTITYSGIEGGATAQCSTDNSTWSTCSASPVTLTGLTEGTKNYYVRQIDQAGNTGPSASVTWIVDTTAPAAPTVTRTSPTVNPTNSTSQTITYSGIEGGATAQCSTDGGSTWATCGSSPVTLSGLSDGSKTYSVRQIDSAGNTGSATTVSWTVDTAAPTALTLTRTSPAASPTNSTSATLTYSGVEGGATAQCSTDNATWTTCGSSPISLTGLTAGTKNYYVRQVDTAGNISPVASTTWIVDLTAPSAPTVTRTAPTSSPTSSTSATITYTPAEGGGTMQCSTDGTTWNTCGGSPVSLTGLTDGAKTYYVRQVDAAGNVGASASVNWVVDSAPPAAPTVVRNAPTSSPTSSTSATISYSGIEPGATAQCSADGGTSWATCTGSPVNLSGLSDGSYSYTVRQIDAAGNTGSASTVTWTVDTAPPAAPSITRDAPTSSPSSSTSATISYSGIEPGATAQCSTNGTTWTTCAASPVTLSGLSDGPHTYYVRQLDAAGNPSTAVSTTWTIDATAPAAPTLSGPPAQTNNPNANFTFSGEPGATFKCKFGSGSYATCTSPVEIPLASDGPYTFSVIQTDTAGNDSPAATVNFTLDTAGPSAPTIDTAPPALSDQDTATFSVTPAEPGGTLRCQIDSQPAATCTSPFTTPSLGDGSHTFTVWQVDSAGNPGDTESFSWAIDTTAPPAPDLTGPSGTVGFTTASIEISNTELGVTFECNVDGAGWNACIDPLELTGLVDGSHTVEVRASDAAGNTSSISAVTWTVDHSLFTVNVTGAPSGVVQATSADLAFTASLPGSTYHCSVDGSTFASCTSPLELDNLTEGDHTVEIYATNGVQTSPTVTRIWTVDTTGPGIAITAPGDDDTTGAAATLEFTSNDLNGPVTTTCSINGGTPFGCSSPESLTNLPAGEVTVTVVATDSAGNSASAAVTWNVDRTAPAVPAITSPSTDTSTNDVRPTISGTAEANTTVKLYDNGGLVATLTSDGSGAWTWTPTADLSVGDHEYTATSVDAYDNESNESPSRTVTIDLTPPAAPVISTPNAGDTNDSTPTVTGTADPNSTVTVYVDGSPVGTTTADGSGAWTLTISPALSDGDHTITADAEDAAGNTGPSSADRDITVDTALPSVAITAPTAGAKLNDTDVEVTFNAESGATVDCMVDSGSWNPCTSPLTIPSLSEGTHTVSVRATDAAGNAATAIVSFNVDRTAPNAPTINGPEGPTQDSTPTFNGNAEPGSSVVVTIGADTYGPVTADNDGHWSITVSPALVDGDYSATAAATDAAGNTSSASDALDFSVDTTAPSAPTIDSPSNAVDDPFVSADPSPAISGNAGSAEAGATITVYVNGNAVGTATAAGDGSWTHTLQTPLSDGTYAITARAEDEAGNQSTLSNTVNIRVDASNPTTTLTGNPGSRSNDPTPTFSFTADEPSTFECRIDGGAWAACTNPHTTATLLDGEHTFEVRAKDASDNYSSPKSYTWTVDTQAPTITVTTSTVAPGVTPTFSIVSSEPGTTYTCKVDAAAPISCSTPFSPGTLPVGTHTLIITGTDGAGNTRQETVTFTVAAPPSNPGNPTTPSSPSSPSSPTAETCPGPDTEEVGVPAKLSLVAAKLSAGGSLVRFTTRADQFVIVRITLRNGSKKLGTVVIDSKANANRNVPIKLKKKLPKNAQIKVRMSAVTMTGGKSVADATLITDSNGKKVAVSGASGKVGEEVKTVVNCGKESDGKKIKVAVKKIANVKVSLKKMTAEITASDWAVATVRVDQGGKKVGRKVIVLKPNKKGKAQLALGTSIGSVTLVKGKAVVTVSTITADGVRQLKKLNLTVK